MRKKRLIKNILFTFMYQIIAIITGFIVPKAIIQSYGSSVNGLINSITQFLAYIYIAEGGVGVVVKYLLYKPIAENNKSEIEKILKSAQKFLRHVVYIYIAYVVILCIIYPKIVANSFDKYFTLSLLLIIAVSRFSEYFMSMEYNIYLQANQQNYIVSIFNSVTVIANTVITIICIKLNCQITTIKIINTLVYMTRSICYKIYVKRKYRINLSKNIEKYAIKQKKDSFVQQIAYIIDSNLDAVLITYFLGTTEVSVYTIYMLVFKGLNNLVNAIMGGVDATFGDMFAKGEYNNANKKFTVYQFMYFFIITILYNLCFLLIIPFVSVYTKGITDANYYRPIFGAIITISEFIYSIKLPYEALIKSIGHFKKLKELSCIEVTINAVISVTCVMKFGLVGVAIGTLIAMIFKLVTVVYYFSKNILKRSLKIDAKFLMLILVQSLTIILIGSRIVNNNIEKYFEWIMTAIKLGIISITIEIIINLIFNKKLMLDIIKKGISIIKTKKQKE